MTSLSRPKNDSSSDSITTIPQSLSDNDNTMPQENYSTMLEQKPRPFWGRKWHPVDLQRVIALLVLHLLCLFAPFYATPSAVVVCISLSVITGMFGITLIYHRLITHKSFTLPKWLEYFLAYLGVLAFQGSPIDWVSTHRYHHQYCDTERDPHSPNEGFWFSHINWLFDRYYLYEKCGRPNNVADLRKQSFYVFIHKTYGLHALSLGPLLYVIGGIPWVVWGMGVRIVLSLHGTWLVNSACHIWGTRTWNTKDLSTNNWFVGILVFGEGWHNNHHAFEYSARHGLEWWQLDTTWIVICLLEAVGLATNVKLPSEEHMKRLAFPRSKDT